MLWLIWIAVMLLTPIVAGVSVWYELHRRVDENAQLDSPGRQGHELG